MAKRSKAVAAVAAETVQATPVAAETVQATPAAAEQAKPAFEITDRQRHMIYLTARKTLAVRPAAQVSWAFLAFARENGLDAAVALVPQLVSTAQGLPAAEFEGIAPKPANPEMVARLLAGGK